eukprot:CAMPEP_0119019982 /NCGR_PEP_ID=MMETSP1176-20130426/23077_1 /TAXON_ID=265551 /ORGANISM="Synedropsis recta cf, Strain CCMP1620" /LENGTH=323 /DNA_ID=CAMNT_0006974325 /DNA_START=254 /DNA_END=1225 /DNA_ORIENTATION=-
MSDNYHNNGNNGNDSGAYYHHDDPYHNGEADQSNGQWLHDTHGQVIEEMTEEQEQEIYSIPASELSRHNRSNPHPKRGLLQRIASIRNNNPNVNGVVGSASPNTSSSSSGHRLQTSYKLLEDEYCKLKFEQTELVALADQRKMEKARSAKLMDSLDEEIRTRRKSNLTLRLDSDQLQEAAEQVRDQLHITATTAAGEQESNHELNSLWLQRDLADHKLQEARDTLYELRKESKAFLDELLTPPIVSEDVVRQEMNRLRKTARVVAGAHHLEQLMLEVQRLRPARKQESLGNTRASMIGKEIMVDDEEHNKDDTVSVITSALFR